VTQPRALRLPRPPRITHSIRWMVALAMMVLVAAVVSAVGAVTERNARRALAVEMESALLLQARQVALVGADALLTETPEWALLPLAKQILERQPQIAFVVVTDHEGMIQGDSDVRRLGSAFTPPAELQPLADAPEPLTGETIAGNHELVVVSTPVVDVDGRTIGSVWAALRQSAIAERLERARREQALVLLVFVLLGIAAALVVSSLVLRPVAALRAGLERIGRGDLKARLEVRDRSEIGALAETVNLMAGQLELAQQDLVHRERLAHEMDLAQRIQKSLLPSRERVVGSFHIEGMQEPASEVGGDYYQTLDLPGDRVGIVVADVAGKGLGGSLVTAMVHALLRALAPVHTSPAALLAVLDRQIAGMIERGSFVTMFYGILDPASGELVFASAGHHPLLVLRDGVANPEWHRAEGVPLGIMRSARAQAVFEDVRVQLRPGDVAVQYTDGVTETVGSKSAGEYGADRMARAALPAAHGGSRAVMAALLESVASWRGVAPRTDDETVLVIARERQGAVNDSRLDQWDAGLGLLAAAEARGSKLVLPASLAALRRIGEWLGRSTPARDLSEGALAALELALHEAAANVVEHAYHFDDEQRLELWWVPEPGREGRAIEAGYFLLRDWGAAFNPQDWKRADLTSSEVRRRGRGLGMEILHRTARTLTYYPATPAGNLVRMAFDPETLGKEAAA
jgi:serine phosphatase RsbU (regulator of sigma subunit)/anti-sigma regulatory factor (Ser/Thr protein kinase)